MCARSTRRRKRSVFDSIICRLRQNSPGKHGKASKWTLLRGESFPLSSCCNCCLVCPRQHPSPRARGSLGIRRLWWNNSIARRRSWPVLPSTYNGRVDQEGVSITAQLIAIQSCVLAVFFPHNDNLPRYYRVIRDPRHRS